MSDGSMGLSPDQFRVRLYSPDTGHGALNVSEQSDEVLKALKKTSELGIASSLSEGVVIYNKEKSKTATM